MSTNIIEEYLSQISEEDKLRMEKEIEEDIQFQEQLIKDGYKWNTDKSYSLKLLNDAGYYPIGITYYYGEETFIFSSARKAKKAWNIRVLGYDGWWYSEKKFRKIKGSEKIYWLWK